MKIFGQKYEQAVNCHPAGNMQRWLHGSCSFCLSTAPASWESLLHKESCRRIARSRTAEVAVLRGADSLQVWRRHWCLWDVYPTSSQLRSLKHSLVTLSCALVLVVVVCADSRFGIPRDCHPDTRLLEVIYDFQVMRQPQHLAPTVQKR